MYLASFGQGPLYSLYSLYSPYSPYSLYSLYSPYSPYSLYSPYSPYSLGDCANGRVAPPWVLYHAVSA